MAVDASPIDLLVKTATVDLLREYNLAVAPASDCGALLKVPPTSLAGTVDFYGDGMNGRLVLVVPRAAVQATSESHGVPAHAELDWVRELTGQLMGRIKRRFARYGKHIRVGLPSSTLAQSTVRQLAQTAEHRGYTFRSLKGEVHVALVGGCDPNLIDYTRVAGSYEEDEVILF